MPTGSEMWRSNGLNTIAGPLKLVLIGTVLFICSVAGVFSQQGPLVHVLPATERVIILLGDTDRQVKGFSVYKRQTLTEEFKPVTEAPVTPVYDPYRAADILGADFDWLSRRVGSRDPEYVLRKLRTDRGQAGAYSLISHGVKVVLGRIFIDGEVTPGESYQYEVRLLDRRGTLLNTVRKRLTVAEPRVPEPPRAVKTEPRDGAVYVSWSYPPYRGLERDLTVGFNVYRKPEGGSFRKITPAPALRAEGYLGFLDEYAQNGVTYSYAVEAVDIIGVSSERIISEPVTPADTSPPLVPRGITATETEDGVLVVWRISPETDVSSYNVFRSTSVSGEDDFEKINPQAVPFDNPQFLDAEIERGTLYTYKVSAVDTSGNESRLSGPSTITPPDKEPPPDISGLSVSIDEKNRSVTLQWNALETADLEGYHIYKGSSKEDLQRLTGAPRAGTKSPSFTDEGFRERGLRPGSRLFYAVTAIDSSLNESTPVFAEAKIPDNEPPSPPQSLNAYLRKEGGIELVWQPSIAKDLASHRIHRKTGKTTEVVQELPAGTNRWIDEDVQNGTKYEYWITETDQSGNESGPSQTVEIIAVDVIPPEPPAGLTAAAEKRKVLISWNASSSPDALSYNIYSSPYEGAKWTKLNRKPQEELSYTDRKGGEGFLYGVSAVDSSGNEGEKAVVRAEKAAGEDQ